jgi:hypothetical protein
MQMEPELFTRLFERYGSLTTDESPNPELRLTIWGGSEDDWLFGRVYEKPTLKRLLTLVKDTSQNSTITSLAKAGLAFLDNEERYPDITAIMVNKRIERELIKAEEERFDELFIRVRRRCS